MTLRRVLTVFGTRPEAIKLAPVVKKLQSAPGFDSILCATGQHREMLDQVLRVFDIRPHYDLDIMQPNQDLSDVTVAALQGVKDVLQAVRPHLILVQGDTTTVMASSIAAYYHHIRVGHVEAGLRTNDKWQPFPEEINRRLASAVTDLHFAPTEWARQNLLRENIPSRQIIVTGNPVIDALQAVVRIPPTSAVLNLFKHIGIPYQPYVPHQEHPSSSPRLILVTAHRRENFGQPLEDICSALNGSAGIYQDQIRIVYPVHLNPNVQEPVHRILGRTPNITLLEPLDYLPMVHLMRHACLVLTDSGGLQEEAPSFGVPVLVMRRVSERPEGIQAGTVRLVGTDPAEILTQARLLLDNPQAYGAMAQAINPYGDGEAARRIVEAILQASS